MPLRFFSYLCPIDPLGGEERLDVGDILNVLYRLLTFD